MAKKVPINLPPGVVKGESMLASVGRFTDSNNVRWVNGRPQKVGGNEAYTSIAVTGHVRGLHAWGDNTGARQFIGIGTAYGLWTISTQSLDPVNITPYEKIETVSDPFATTNGSPTVTVSLTGHGAAIGDTVNFDGASAVAGLTITGNYTVATVPTADTFTITAASNANATTTGGGSVTISIELGPGEEDISAGFGWGVGGWGESTWGTPRDLSTILNYPRAWALDNFGKLLLANVVDGGLYSWDPMAAPIPRASIVSGAPTQIAYMFVTSERTVFLLGTNTGGGDQNKMQVHWSGQGTFDDWNILATVSTAAGSPSRTRVMTKGTRLIAGCDLGSLVSLIWSDEAVYVFQYLGNQFVYQSRLAGENCGIAGPDAFCTVGGVAYWLGNDRFWFYNGAVQEIPNQDDIKEWLFAQMRANYGVKASVWFNERFNEVWFGVVAEGQTEVTMAAVWMRSNGRWFICDIERTAATRLSGDNTSVILAGHDGILYAHDRGVDDNGAALDWYLETSVMEIEDGDLVYEVQSVSLDMQKRTGPVDVTLTGYDESDPEASAIDTETVTIPQGQGSEDFRTTARLIKMRLSGSGVGCDFRMGIPKVEVVPAARR